jgi:hypothetical protein
MPWGRTGKAVSDGHLLHHGDVRWAIREDDERRTTNDGPEAMHGFLDGTAASDTYPLHFILYCSKTAPACSCFSGTAPSSSSWSDYVLATVTIELSSAGACSP